MRPRCSPSSPGGPETRRHEVHYHPAGVAVDCALGAGAAVRVIKVAVDCALGAGAAVRVIVIGWCFVIGGGIGGIADCHGLHRTHPLRTWTVNAVPGEHNQFEGSPEQRDGAADQEDPPRRVPRLAQHHQRAHHRNHIEQQRLERLTWQPELDQPDERRRRAQDHQSDPHKDHPGHPPPVGSSYCPIGHSGVHSGQPR